ncbi:MAG: hypothetical protein ACP5NV_05205 [Candidatus Woesearchaeota archaeon]
MNKNNLYILLIIQALISLLLLFVEPGEKVLFYTVLGVYIFLDFVLFIKLLFRNWTIRNLYLFTTVLVSALYILFLVFVKGQMMILTAVGVMILFLLSAIIDFEKVKRKELPMPQKPKMSQTVETYDLEDMEHELDTMDKQKKEDAKYRAKAMAYELEREASELKRAENFVRKKNTELTEKEILSEAKKLETVGKQASIIEKAVKDAQLKSQAKKLEYAEKKIRDMEIKKEAKELVDAEKKIKELDFLSKQQELNRQAIELVKAQAQVDKKKKVNSTKSKSSKMLKSRKDNPVFATYSGNNFHETGCMVIKKIPKKNLILFNNPKEALKKGYKPCNVCKP